MTKLKDENAKINGGHDDTTHAKSFEDNYEEISILTYLFASIGFYFMMTIALLNAYIFHHKEPKEKHRDGYTPLLDPFAKLYRQHVVRRIQDCITQPICSGPSSEVNIMKRTSDDNGWTLKFSPDETKYINFGSFNYLGTAENNGPYAKAACEAVETYGVATCSTRRELGSNQLHNELEILTAQFLGVEDSIVFGMGFATNALNLPAILSPGCLVLSDEKNHASIVLGIILSGAKVKVYKHNNMKSLEDTLQQAIVDGQPNGAPWRKIFIVIEGIFSMEGSIAKLPEIIAIKKKYRAYIYMDEAHSIGAMGPNGRGITDYYGVDPRDVDVLMGTFSKSFGSAGGYIAGSTKLINSLRVKSLAHCYGNSMTPAVAQQILSSMKTIMGLDGTNEGRMKIDQLYQNTKYFRSQLSQIGCIVYGHKDSPVIPLITFTMSKTVASGRALKDKKIAVVVVGYPATPFLKARLRFCLSAAHTREQLDRTLLEIKKITNKFGLNYSSKPRKQSPSLITSAWKRFQFNCSDYHRTVR